MENEKVMQEVKEKLQSVLIALTVAVAIVRVDHPELARMLVSVGVEAKKAIR